MEELSAAAPPKSAAGRLAQVVLAATLTLGSLAYSVGLTRKLGVVVFPSSSSPRSTASASALLFVSFPVAPRRAREQIPWYDWLLAAAGLAAGLYVAVNFPHHGHGRDGHRWSCCSSPA